MRTCPSCGARYEAPAQYCQRDGAALRVEQEARDPYLGTKILGQFRLERVIGSGGMGMVYSAWDEGLGRRVAVKILHRDLVTNRDVVARFHREAQIAHQLDHPNIVRVILFGQLPDDNLYLVLEYLDGPTLLAALDKGPMAPARAVKILAAIADAMGYAHRRDIVHRDLKPENIILVQRDGDPDHPKVLDFGIAKMLMGADTVVTQAGLIFGTARYISPEGAQGDPVDKRSDVYSLGVIAYQMLTGHTPFEAAEPVQLLLKHIHEPPPPMRTFPAGQQVPPALEAVVLRALAKTPAARYGDGAAFARALREALAESDPDRAIKSMTATVNMPMWVSANAPASRPAGTEPPARDDRSGVRSNPAAPNSFDPQATMFSGSLSAPASLPTPARAPVYATLPSLNPPPADALPIASSPAVSTFASAKDTRPPAQALATRVEMPVTLPIAHTTAPDAAGAATSTVAPTVPSPARSLAPKGVVVPAALALSDHAVPANEHVTGPYSPPARAAGEALISTANDEDFEIPGLPRRGTRGSGLRTARTVILSCLLTVLAGAGAAWALGLYPSQRQEAQVRSLLHRAQDALAARRYMHDPQGNDVEDLTDAVLLISPSNARARQIRVIAAQNLRNRAVELRNEQRVAEALPLLRGALRLVDNTEYRDLLATFEREAATPSAPPTPLSPVTPPANTPGTQGAHPAQPTRANASSNTRPRSTNNSNSSQSQGSPPLDPSPVTTGPTFTPDPHGANQNRTLPPPVIPPPPPVIIQAPPTPGPASGTTSPETESPPPPVITAPQTSPDPPEVGF